MTARHWRSLDELVAGAADFGPPDAPPVPAPPASPTSTDTLPGHDAHPGTGRREFLKMMAASLALAGLQGCGRPPRQTILPYVDAQSQRMPGSPTFYATVLDIDGYGCGVLVEDNGGRPTKVEGNPSHPASLGATGLFAQAAVFGLWDPDRSRTPVHRGGIATWDGFRAALAQRRARLHANGGRGLHVLGGTLTSPTLDAQRRALLARYPRARWHQYQPLNRDNVYAGARLAFGRALEPRYRFDRARVVVSLDADFLASMPGATRYAHDFALARRPGTSMNRLYALEPTPSLTGASADHRWPLRQHELAAFARRLAARVRDGVPTGDARVDAIAGDLLRHRGHSLVLAGDAQPPAVHAAAHAINAELGNFGDTVELAEPIAFEPEDQAASLTALAARLHAGEVDTLLVLDGNPVYHAPPDLHFADAMARAGTAIHLGEYFDETAAHSDWHVPQAHPLESWGDVRAYDGTVALRQPLIAPLHGGRSAHELLGLLLGEADPDAYAIVRRYWRQRYAGIDHDRADVAATALDTTGLEAAGFDAVGFDTAWERWLHAGVVEGTALPPVPVPAAAPLPVGDAEPASSRNGIDLLFRPDPTIGDGRHANNAWLQELPKPLSLLTWGNAALIGPALAAQHQLRNGDVVEIDAGGRSVHAPVWVMPGQATNTVTIMLGYGRERAGHTGTGLGYDGYRLRRSRTPWIAHGARLRATGGHEALVTTQSHHSMEGRDLVRRFDLPMLPAAAGAAPDRPSLYPGYRYEDGHAWAMGIDLNSCIGCNACTLACQAENNIPVVGKAQVARGREMHWIRVDRYFDGAPQDPRVLFQPVPCMHCEQAPCELVCPVGATVHDSEGLNVQVYNRCVGTRFCSNNCPYKVRRFNFLQYADDGAFDAARRNPQVTVRDRGVMEKCTYCVQRISRARIAAERDGRPLRDGDVVTACQAVCPSRAIVFGDLNEPGSAVQRLRADVRDYALLGELNTRPRTHYLARVRNPNPALADG